MRLLEGGAPLQDLARLGFPQWIEERLRPMLRLPQGMILVTGPTGSGKSTTLYSSLLLIRRPSINIITAEDPVEYAVAGLNQVQVNTKAGLTFASCLRSILRQDPNVIMIGEIRDKETAEIALKAARPATWSFPPCIPTTASPPSRAYSTWAYPDFRLPHRSPPSSRNA
jgi:type IV pilus assembly protein PilB